MMVWVQVPKSDGERHQNVHTGSKPLDLGADHPTL